jgi:hypothetical protein
MPTTQRRNEATRSEIPDWIRARDAARTQLDTWFTKRRPLAPYGTIRCGLCGAGLHARWRSARDAIKLSCEGCAMEVDVARAKEWQVRWRASDPRDPRKVDQKALLRALRRFQREGWRP